MESRNSTNKDQTIYKGNDSWQFYVQKGNMITWRYDLTYFIILIQC